MSEPASLFSQFRLPHPLPPTPHPPLPSPLIQKISRAPSNVERAMALLAKAVKIELEKQSDLRLEEKLASALQKNLVPIHPASPFHGTDLVLFSDGYKGHLPLNGIKFSDFRSLEELYHRITEGKTNIAIRGGDEFHGEIAKEILILLTRRSGQQLLQQITEHRDKRVTVHPATPTFPNSITKWGRTNGEVDIYLSFEQDQILVRSPHTGSLRPMESPLAISLGHELIHALHIFSSPSIEEYKRTRNDPPSLDIRCHNMEEESTIMTRVPRSPHFSSPPATPIAFARSEEDLSVSCPITENLLRADFGLPPRIGHQGVSRKPVSNDLFDPNVQEYFMQCCHSGLLEEMQRLIGLGMNINLCCSIDPKRRTPLMCAASGGSWEAVELLLRCGAYPYFVDARGLTLLHYAIRSENPAFVQNLIQRGIVDPILADRTGEPLIPYTVLHLKDRCLPMVDLLRGCGASPLAASSDGQTALHSAATLQDPTLFHSLLSIGLDPLAPNANGILPLHTALIAGNLEIFNRLCSSPEQFYQLTPCGKNLMFFAMWSGKKEAVLHILESERKYKRILTPPFEMMACRDRSQALPSSFAFKNAMWEEGQDFILFLMSLGPSFTVQPSNYGDFVTLFATAEQHIRKEMLDRIYRIPGSISEPLCYGEPLFRWAVKEGDLDLATYALLHGALVNEPATEERPTTALHDAVDENRPGMVKFLLQRGADTRAEDLEGLTPLEYALEKIANGDALDFSIISEMLKTRTAAVAALGARIIFGSGSAPA